MTIIGWWLIGLATLLLIEKGTKQSISGDICGSLALFVGIIIHYLISSSILLFFDTWAGLWLLAGEVIVSLYIVWLCWARVHRLFLNWGKGVAQKQVIVVVIGLLTVGGYLGWTQLTNNYLHSDGLAFWFTRGQVIAEASPLRPALWDHPDYGNLVNPEERATLTRYPLAVSVSVATVFSQAGENIAQAKIIWVGLFLSFLAYLYAWGRVVWGKTSWWAVCLPFVYLGVPVGWRLFTPYWFGSADLWVMTYLAVGLASAYLAITRNGRQYLYLAAFLLGMATVTKFEGIIGWVFVGVLILLHRLWGWRTVGIAAVLVMLPAILWYGFTLSLPATGELAGTVAGRWNWMDYIQVQAVRIWPRLIREWGNVSLYHGVFIISFLVMVFLFVRRRYQPWWWLYSFPILGMGLIALAYTIKPLDFEDLVYTTLPRLYAQWVGVLLVLTAAAMSHIAKNQAGPTLKQSGKKQRRLDSEQLGGK